MTIILCDDVSDRRLPPRALAYTVAGYSQVPIPKGLLCRCLSAKSQPYCLFSTSSFEFLKRFGIIAWLRTGEDFTSPFDSEPGTGNLASHDRPAVAGVCSKHPAKGWIISANSRFPGLALPASSRSRRKQWACTSTISLSLVSHWKNSRKHGPILFMAFMGMLNKIHSYDWLGRQEHLQTWPEKTATEAFALSSGIGFSSLMRLTKHGHNTR